MNAKTKTKLILVVGLIAAYSSTSFAANTATVANAVTKEPKGTAIVNGKGGGTGQQEKTCLTNSQAILLRADQVGLKPDQIALGVTERPAEFSLCGGKTKISPDPDAAEDQSRPGTTPSASKKFGWCIKNADLAKKLGFTAPGDDKKFNCSDNFSSAGGNNSNNNNTMTIDFEIPCDGEKLKGQIITISDAQGNVKESKIKISSTDHNAYPHFLELRETYQKLDANGEKVKGKFSVLQKTKENDKVTGSIHFPIEGTIKKDPNDPDARNKFSTCKVDMDGEGPINKNETANPKAIDIAGSCNVYRGTTVPMLGELKEVCKSAEATSSNVIQQYSSRGGGGYDGN